MNLVAAIDRVRTTLGEHESECSLNEVLGLCPELSCYQVILAFDYLSRTGEILVQLDEANGCKVLSHRPTHSSTGEDGVFGGHHAKPTAQTRCEDRAPRVRTRKRRIATPAQGSGSNAPGRPS